MYVWGLNNVIFTIRSCQNRYEKNLLWSSDIV